MDIALPGMSGIDAFKEIRKMPLLQNIPVIALTASAMLQERETILSHGFDAFISKPILTKHFYEVINEVLYGK
jgi:CheY-like chemotaxis protein